MNAVEIEEAISALADQPFDATEFPFAFLQAFGNKETTIKKLRAGASNRSDLGGQSVPRAESRDRRLGRHAGRNDRIRRTQNHRQFSLRLRRKHVDDLFRPCRKNPSRCFGLQDSAFHLKSGDVREFESGSQHL